MNKIRNILASVRLQVDRGFRYAGRIVLLIRLIRRSPVYTSRAGGASSFAHRERTRVGSSPMLVISQHRSRKGTPP